MGGKIRSKKGLSSGLDRGMIGACSAKGGISRTSPVYAIEMVRCWCEKARKNFNQTVCLPGRTKLPVTPGIRLAPGAGLNGSLGNALSFRKEFPN
jgi:hypothetical protein